MIQAVRGRNYKETVKQMKISRRYTQMPNRADELIDMMEACYESQEMEG
jgi:hypothetical protein